MQDDISRQDDDGGLCLDALAYLLSCYDVWSATPLAARAPCAAPPDGPESRR